LSYHYYATTDEFHRDKHIQRKIPGSKSEEIKTVCKKIKALMTW